MKRFAVPAVVIAACLALVGVIVYGVASKSSASGLDGAVADGGRPAAPATSLELPVLGSGTAKRSLASYRGKVVVLNFWASWCPPCRDEAPVLERTQRRIAGHGATVLGIDLNDATHDARAFVREHRLSFPSLRDIGGKLADAYGTKGLPETFVLDRKGRVVALRRYQVDAAFLKRSLRPLLGSEAS